MIRKLKIFGVLSFGSAILAQLFCISGNSLYSFGSSPVLVSAGFSLRHLAWVFTDCNLVSIAFLNLETLRLFSSLALNSDFLTETRLARFKQLWFILTLLLFPNLAKQFSFTFTSNDILSISELADILELLYAILVIAYDNLQLLYLSNLVVKLHGKCTKEGVRIYNEVLTLNQIAVFFDWFGVLLATVNMLHVYEWHDTLNFVTSAVSSIHIGLLVVAVSRLKDLFRTKLNVSSKNLPPKILTDGGPKTKLGSANIISPTH
ncbi:hypothetical protein HDV03_001525 [Kappamyces sp. JEL0829]|nr:hypothetical protein HDV03_001525 [Kappamyces sp. JEL0829]